MILEHHLRERAYYIWEREGRIAGREDAHWAQAHAELRAAGAPLSIAPVAAEASLAQSPAKALKTTRKASAKAEPKAAKARKASRAADAVALH